MKNKKIYGISKVLTALLVIAALSLPAVAMQSKPPKTVTDKMPACRQWGKEAF